MDYNSYAAYCLTEYALEKELIVKEDKEYVVNRLIEAMSAEYFIEDQSFQNIEGGAIDIHEVLQKVIQTAKQNGTIDDGITSADLFDTKIMGIITPPPSVVNRKFWEKFNQSPEKATDYFFSLCKDTNYIRSDRVKKDVSYKIDSDYGEIDITINLSKPEKDPKAIAAEKNKKQSGYPKCLLCVENEGFAGTLTHPARQNLRIVNMTLDGEQWGLQYSPYTYYNEHCIVLDKSHSPMKITENTFNKLLDFVKILPHYFVGSNADLPIVGGSILSHNHFQGGNYEFAMAKAPVETEFAIEKFGGVDCGIVRWPMSVIRLRSKEKQTLSKCCLHVFNKWAKYTDQQAFIFSETDGETHNTVTPIARKRGEYYEMDLVLRNNKTTEQHPLGVYHPHAELHHIKKENIGLIEVMGLAVLPARLKEELKEVEIALEKKLDLDANPKTAAHADWARGIAKQHDLTKEDIAEVIRLEVGKAFVEVLHHAGVFKRDEQGKQAFLRFAQTL